MRYNPFVYCCLIFSLFSTHSFAELHIQRQWVMPHSQVNPDIARHAIPPTPQQMSLPQFGQGVIGWGTGIAGAKQRLEHITADDVKRIQQQGTTLAMIQAWHDFYANENQRNPSNITAIYRKQLMQKIIDLWTAEISKHEDEK